MRRGASAEITDLSPGQRKQVCESPFSGFSITSGDFVSCYHLFITPFISNLGSRSKSESLCTQLSDTKTLATAFKKSDKHGPKNHY
jgi:hypothetical protein